MCPAGCGLNVGPDRPNGLFSPFSPVDRLALLTGGSRAVAQNQIRKKLAVGQIA